MNSDDLFSNSSQAGSLNSFQKLLDFLNRLDDAGLPYSLEHNSDETLMVLVSTEGERWEVEFFADGEVQVEVFYSVNEEDDLEGEDALERLFLDEDDDEFDDEIEEDDLEEDTEVDEVYSEDDDKR
ncbi:MAG: hypothetical protein ACRBCS_00030 [Cellvibrionaceae bacterium]